MLWFLKKCIKLDLLVHGKSESIVRFYTKRTCSVVTEGIKLSTCIHITYVLYIRHYLTYTLYIRKNSQRWAYSVLFSTGLFFFTRNVKRCEINRSWTNIIEYISSKRVSIGFCPGYYIVKHLGYKKKIHPQRRSEKLSDNV